MTSSKTLKNLDLKRRYDPCVDGTDVIKEVYIPCLSNSVRYDRIAAYFNSAVLQLYSAGLVNLYKNGGHARYIFSCETNDIDLQKIADAYKDKMDSLADEIDDTLITDYNVANLSYLIVHNMAEIKIAFMLNGKSSIMHVKQGIFEDSDGYKVCFDGSGNETPAGLQENCEIFTVHTDFSQEDPYIDDAEDLFRKMWNNTYSPGKVYCATPEGILFEKLCKFNRGRLFDSQEEYNSVLYDKKVYIDIDEEKTSIIIYDYSEDKCISYRNGLKSIYNNRIKQVSDNTYIIDELTLSDLRDRIPQIISRFDVEYVFSSRAEDYLNQYNLEIEKREKLGSSIKEKRFSDGWEDQYINFKNIIDYETIGRLKEEQYLNAFHHYKMKSSFDFSVPGTGKTYISYGLFAYLHSNYTKERDVSHLVILGPKVCFNAWKEECAALFGDKFLIFDVSEVSDWAKDLRQNKYHIYLINYELFNNPKTIQTLSDYVIDSKTMLVLDEVHRIKKIDGKRSSNIVNLFTSVADKPIYKLALTGTPIPNSFLDLYNYLQILFKDDLQGFLSPLSYSNLSHADNDDGKAEEVKKALYPLFTRTTKADLGIEPANDDDLTTLSATPSEDEERLYELIYKAYQNENPLTRIIRLIQASSNPRLLLKRIDAAEIKAISDEDFDVDVFESSGVALYRSDIEKEVDIIGLSSKFKKTVSFVNQTVKSDEKIIIWCLFVDTIHLLEDELSKKGIKSVVITGSDALSFRNEKLNKFKNGDIDVLITNPNTLAESVSLHMTCHKAIYFEYGFNLTYMLQSKDRIHRVGLLKGTQTNYYYAITDSDEVIGNIDMKIYSRLKLKENRMKEAIESNDLIFIPDEGDLDDIKFILKEIDSGK